MVRIFISVLLVLAFGQIACAKTVSYEFDIEKGMVNKTGVSVPGMMIDGQTPGPVIEAVEGDTLKVTFHNRMDVLTSIHWHGILLPNDQDGVPYLTTAPIAVGGSITYEFPIIQSGTYWYHSHTGLQEQRGVYGAMVFHKKAEMGEMMGDMGNMSHSKMSHDKVPYNNAAPPKPQERVLVFSDWSNEDPKHILKNLKKDGDYYALKKGSVQSWLGVLENGSEAINNRISGALSRMGPMDISDVGYDAFLVNGKQVDDVGEVPVGEMVKLRLVNASASSYFNVEFSGGPMTIVAADGIDVTPLKVTRLRMAIAETYDVLVKLPMDMAYEVRATSEDGTGYASAWLGQGHKMPAPDIPRPNLYLQGHDMMEHDMGEMSGMDHSNMKMPSMKTSSMPPPSMKMPSMEPKDDHAMHNMMEMGADISIAGGAPVIAHMTDYAALKSPVKTTLPQTNLRTVNLALTGNMERYVWSFNNTVLSKADSILIKKGETVRFVLKNETMMHHPVHLHGHFFRVLNGQDDYSPLKHTVNVAPMSTMIIEFEADTEKDWFFHCHNLYHMMGGMARVVSYEGSTKYTNAVRSKIAETHWYSANSHTLQNNIMYGEARVSNTDTALSVEYDWDYNGAYDVSAVAERQLTRFLSVYGGVRAEREGANSAETNAVIGARYVLPLMIEVDLQLASNGHVELEVGSYLQLTSRLGLEWEASTDADYRAGFAYALNKKLSLAAGWDSEQGWGGGVKLDF